MIIFDLDGTLADCEHRRHFVENPKDTCHCFEALKIGGCDADYKCLTCKKFPHKWQPDWKAFYEACDKDGLIAPTLHILDEYLQNGYDVQIWSGRCESVRTKTENWLDDHCDLWAAVDLGKYNDYRHILKMRPIGNTEPDEVLKERWLNERCADLIEAQIKGTIPVKHDIDFVFDDRPKVIRMWRRRGIFVFNCCQHDEES